MITLEITSQKNLLAFSGGVDSTALFFLLLERHIPFDIAIVNYNTRTQSRQELVYALSLALKYKKQCFIQHATLEKSNFEYNARQLRYDFFEELIEEHSYETLLTAHQLNDKLEWFLMQLSKGAGLHELLGLNEHLIKPNYTITRPLLEVSKTTLEEYLKTNNIKYFYDESNSDLSYTRNYFRHHFSNSFIQEFESGVKKSFTYLQKDLNSLASTNEPIYKYKELTVFNAHLDDNLNIRLIDAYLKQKGYLLSHAQREEILKQKKSVIDTFAICITPLYIFIAPYIKTVMPKIFKEKYRVLKIPAKIRAYIFQEEIEPSDLLFLK
ncbi:MAG: tRNA lysidine(34) synthetase TilS [Arcobacteraceae bacterium]